MLVIGTALVLVTIYISITIRRMAEWGLMRRGFQSALFLMAGGLAYYLAITGWMGVGIDFLTLFNLTFVGFVSLIVGVGTAITFWSFRGREWDLVAWALIFLVAAYFSAAFWFPGRDYDFVVVWLIGLLFAPGLTTAGVLFLLRRVRLRIAIIVSVLVLLVGSGIVLFFQLIMMSS